MRALCLIVLLGCTSTRQLAHPADPRLRAPIAGTGIVVPTTTRWKERVDPFTTLRVRSGDGAWSDAFASRVVHVDRRGMWLDGYAVMLSRYADEIELTGAPPELVAIAEDTRTSEARLVVDGDVATLHAAPSVMQIWLVAIEDAIGKHGQQLELDIRSRHVPGRRAIGLPEAAAIYTLGVATLRVHTPQLGWASPVYDVSLGAALRVRTPSRVGWPWEQVAAVEVENISGGKTLGAIIGLAAASVLVIPAALVMRGVPAAQGRAPSNGNATANAVDAISRIGDGSPPPGTWQPEPAPTESLEAPVMFGDRAVARALLRGTLALDGFAAKTGDLAGTGVIAKVRFAQAFEIGGGVRAVGSRDERGWRRSVTPVFAMGTHLPLDAAQRFALPIGFEVSGGGAIAVDVRFPWGFRYTPHGGRWFGTLQPATPAWMRTTSEKTGRWTLNGSVEVGVSF